MVSRHDAGLYGGLNCGLDGGLNGRLNSGPCSGQRGWGRRCYGRDGHAFRIGNVLRADDAGARQILRRRYADLERPWVVIELEAAHRRAARRVRDHDISAQAVNEDPTWP